jgi:UDP-N-acetylmuramate: L-alanyl-gamma-D-glutamyl-meso-diaminopimelate ligase
LLPKSVLICNSDYPILAEIAAKEKTRGNLQVITYGCNKEADYVVTSREHLYDPYRQKVTISFREDRFSYEINQFGEIYALNSLAVIVASLQCKQGSIGSLVETLKSYQGIKRRQEIVISSESITLIDDFAHHPTAVNTTLKAIREAYPDRHLVAIFEPRSNTSRRRVFQEAYVTAFLKADEVIIGHVVPRESDKGIDLFSSSELVTALSESGKKAYSFPTSSDILTFVRESLREPTLLVVMSNGAFGGLVDSLKSFLAVKA